jgi:hypothetical protein
VARKFFGFDAKVVKEDVEHRTWQFDQSSPTGGRKWAACFVAPKCPQAGIKIVTMPPASGNSSIAVIITVGSAGNTRPKWQTNVGFLDFQKKW